VLKEVSFLEIDVVLAFELEDPLEFNQTINNNLIRAQDIINELNQDDEDRHAVTPPFASLGP
jgi:hypothetical protein